MSHEEVTPERLAKLEERLERAERMVWRLRRRQRTCNGLALFAVLFVLFANKSTLAIRYGATLDALAGRVASLETIFSRLMEDQIQSADRTIRPTEETNPGYGGCGMYILEMERQARGATASR
jgi:hypothetical protein